MHRIAGALLWIGVLSLVPGCGDGIGTVRGTVSLDGQAIQSGRITFTSTEGDLVSEGSVIMNGAFNTRLPPGKYKVELSAQRPAGTRVQIGFDGKEEEIKLTAEMFPDY